MTTEYSTILQHFYHETSSNLYEFLELFKYFINDLNIDIILENKNNESLKKMKRMNQLFHFLIKIQEYYVNNSEDSIFKWVIIVLLNSTIFLEDCITNYFSSIEDFENFDDYSMIMIEINELSQIDFYFYFLYKYESIGDFSDYFTEIEMNNIEMNVVVYMITINWYIFFKGLALNLNSKYNIYNENTFNIIIDNKSDTVNLIGLLKIFNQENKTIDTLNINWKKRNEYITLINYGNSGILSNEYKYLTNELISKEICLFL